MDCGKRKRNRRLAGRLMSSVLMSVLMGALLCTGPGAEGGMALASAGIEQPSADTEVISGGREKLGSAAKKIISESKETGRDVNRSGYVAITNNVIFFPYDNHLCSALIKEDGSVIEIISEGRFSEKLFGLNVYGTDLYLALQSGFYKLDLKTMEQPELLSE